MAAALLPRVRLLVVCDTATPSDIEDGVFNLEGVRQQVIAPSFPFPYTLSVYLLLSNPRKGTFPGRVLLVDDEDDERYLRYVRFVAVFEEVARPLPLAVDLGECVFPAPRVYSIRVSFTSPTGDEVQKGETYFEVLELQE